MRRLATWWRGPLRPLDDVLLRAHWGLWSSTSITSYTIDPDGTERRRSANPLTPLRIDPFTPLRAAFGDVQYAAHRAALGFRAMIDTLDMNGGL